MNKKEKSKFYKYLNKDIKEFNRLLLSLVCVVILVGAGLLSYFITTSYALFSDSITGTKTIEVGVKLSSLDKSGANKPILDDNMIPVYYDETNEVWKKADSNNKDEKYKWYDYNNKMWANSVTVSSTNRSTYLNAVPGTEIDMDDILTMQVWIPRFKYKVWNYNADGNSASEEQEIEITFEEGATTTGEITCQDAISGTDGSASETCKLKSANTTCTDNTCNNKTYTHPAFTFGDEELKGFWIGKFEVSSDITCTITNYASLGSGCNLNTINPLVKPDVISWRGAQVGTYEHNIMAMNDNNNIYGFSNNIDTHVIKNSEWGAVSYLSHSKYGTCENGVCREIYINNSSSKYTGRSGGSAGGSTKISDVYTSQSSTDEYNTYGFYTYDGYLLNYDTNTKGTTKDLNKVASTTGNIYGVYDMSGGSWEYTMSNMISNNSNTLISGSSSSYNSGYTGILYNNATYTSYTGSYTYPEPKYIDKYSFNTSDTSIKLSKLGDGIKEIYMGSDGWYSDYSHVVISSGPWFIRDGSYDSGSNAGIFCSDNYYGTSYGNISTHLVLSVLS